MLFLIAVKDDDRFFMMRNSLKQCGCTSYRADTPAAVLEEFEEGKCDAAVVCNDVPGLDVVSLLKIVREDGIRIPVMVINKKEDLTFTVDCLEAGADDSMTLPLYPAEFQARAKAMLRRKEQYTSASIQFGDFTMDGTRITLSSVAGTAALTRKEFQMLRLLISNPGAVFSSDDLKDKLWGPGYLEGNLNVVWTTVSSLRRKLRQVGSRVKLKCVRHFGYSLYDPQQ